MGKKYNDPSIQNALGIADGTFLVPVAHPTTGKIYKIPVALLQALFSGYLNKQTGSAYTPSLNDMNGVVQMNNASANAINLPNSATVGYLPGAQLCVWNYGAGATTINATSGVVITNNVTSLSQGQSAVLVYNGKNGSNQDEWALLGSGTGTTTGGGTGTTLNAPVLTAGTPTTTTVPLTWTDTNSSPNESSFEYQQSSDGGTTWGAASPGTAAANATGATAGGLSAATAYKFRARAVGNGTTTITSAWSNVVSATTGGIVLTNITWPTTSSTFTESPTGTFAAASGAYGLSALKIPLGTSGFVMMDFPNVNSETVVLGLDVQNALEYYALAAAPNNQNYDYAIYAYSGNVYKGTNGGQPVNVGTSAAGDKYRLNKVVSGANMTVTAERSTDGGTTWTILYTYAAQTDADLFIKCSFAAASKLLVNPKGNNIS